MTNVMIWRKNERFSLIVKKKFSRMHEMTLNLIVNFEWNDMHHRVHDDGVDARESLVDVSGI